MEPDISKEEQRVLRKKAREAVLEAVHALGGEAERRPIIARSKELGGFTDRELAAPAPNPKYPGCVEYELSWALTNLKRKGRLVNPRYGVWALREAPEEPPVAAPVLADRLAQLQAMAYREYLRTPEWRETAATAKARAEHHCQLNAAHEGPLHVHHNNYERLGEERVADLLVLCETCHERHHEADGRPRRADRRPESVPPPNRRAPRPSDAPPQRERRSLLDRLLSR